MIDIQIGSDWLQALKMYDLKKGNVTKERAFSKSAPGINFYPRPCTHNCWFKRNNIETFSN